MNKKQENLQDRFQVISELISGAVYSFTVDPDKNLIFDWSTAGIPNLAGYTTEELAGIGGWERIVHQDDLKVIQDQVVSLLSNNPKTIEYRIQPKCGSRRWMRDHARPIWSNDEKRVIRIEGVLEDITAWKEADLQTRESNAYLMTILDSVLADIYVADMKTHEILYMNAQMIKSFGKDLTGETCWKVFRNESGPCGHCTNHLLLNDKNEIADTVIWEAMNPIAGKYYLNHDRAIQWVTGDYVRLEISVDITDRKQMEADLVDGEERYRNLFKTRNEGVIFLDYEAMRFVDVNDAACEMYGYTREEFLKLTPKEISAEVDETYRVLNRTVTNKEQQNVRQMSHRKKNGDIIVVETSNSYFKAKNRKMICSTHRDITERKRNEELLIQTEKMMSVGGLAAGMAHELNNPLGGMIQGIQNIERRLSNELPANRESAELAGIDLSNLQTYLENRGINRFIEGIQDSGEKAARIITNMLQFCRKSESKLVLVDLPEMIERAIELASQDYDIKKRFDFKSINIEKSFQPNLPKIPCTETQIEQVLLNLLNNAAWAMNQNATDKPPRISLRIHVDGDMISLEVEDNGPGMTEEVRKRVFEPFYTTKPVGEGTGLGLSVSYMIITNNHDGELEVLSEPDKGTTFIIRLPLENTEQKSP